MKSKSLIISILLLVIGVLSIVLENYFYQYVDEKGILHESLLMPFGALCVMFGIVGLTFSVLKMIWSKCKR